MHSVTNVLLSSVDSFYFTLRDDLNLRRKKEETKQQQRQIIKLKKEPGVVAIYYL